MGSFKNYFFHSQSLPAIESSIKNVSTSIATIASSINYVNRMDDKPWIFKLFKEREESRLKQVAKFSNEVSSLLHSEGFIEELSSRIGEPLLDETEDEFVRRAKNSMRKLLSQKLNP